MPYNLNLKKLEPEELETIRSVNPHVWEVIKKVISEHGETELGSALSVEISAERTKQHLGRFEMAEAIKNLPYKVAELLEIKRQQAKG